MPLKFKGDVQVFGKIKYVFMVTALTFLASASHAKNNLPEKGIAATEEAAIRLAEAILINVYGPEITSERPFVIKLKDGFWIISGSIHCPAGSNCKGGVAHIEIAKKDGRVRNVIHDK